MKMKKKMILLVSLLLLTAAVLGGMPQDAWADTQSKEYVVDDAGLFTDKEKEQLFFLKHSKSCSSVFRIIKLKYSRDQFKWGILF